MPRIEIIVADNNFLVRKGIASIVSSNPELELVAEAKNQNELHFKILFKYFKSSSIRKSNRF